LEWPWSGLIKMRYASEVYKAVVELVKWRLAKAKSK